MIFFKLLLSAFLIAPAFSAAMTNDQEDDLLSSMASSCLPYATEIKNHLDTSTQAGYKNVLVIGATPGEAHHFNFTGLDGGHTVFYSGYMNGKEYECSTYLYDVSRTDMSSGYQQSSPFISMNYNHNAQRAAFASVARDGFDLILTDGNVCGYLQWNAQMVNDLVSMLKPGGQFFFDGHVSTGGDIFSTIAIGIDKNSIDGIETRGNSASYHSWAEGQYVPVLRTVRDLIDGHYFNPMESAERSSDPWNKLVKERTHPSYLPLQPGKIKAPKERVRLSDAHLTRGAYIYLSTNREIDAEINHILTPQITELNSLQARYADLTPEDKSRLEILGEEFSSMYDSLKQEKYKIDPDLTHAIDESHLRYLNEWFGEHVTFPCAIERDVDAARTKTLRPNSKYSYSKPIIVTRFS